MSRSLLVLALLLSSCITTDATLLDPAQRYAPTNHVEILLDAPACPYETIALLESSGGAGTKETYLLRDLRRKARDLGAHAILRYESDGYYTVGGTVSTLRVIAIRYINGDRCPAR